MKSEILEHMPNALLIWQKIEIEAQRRAQARFEEIMNKKDVPAGKPGQQHTKSQGIYGNTRH